MDFVTRFAPSPTGRLHLGHVASALHVWSAAQAMGGTVLLRIEDVDQGRCRADYHAEILKDLAWLGLTWPEPVRVQSNHFSAYTRVIEALAARGLVYRCFRTRAEISELAGDRPFMGGPLAERTMREKLEAGEAFAWRLSLAAAREALGADWAALSYLEATEPGGPPTRQRAEPERHGDVVLGRKDTPAAYHLASTHDDALQGVTHIIRGTDLIDAPHIHRLIQVLMGWPEPVYSHHPVLLGPDGKKLSKRDGSESLAALRQLGLTAQDVRARAGF
ncbi:MAG: tRNA glutamyl-Q(34) synthetase GluQRS [Pseudomonadota bacterium]